MLSKTLGASRRFARAGAAAGEFPQLLYSLLVPHCDDFGRQPGDAFTVKHRVFPTSPRTEDEFEVALVAMEEADLIRRYVAGGNQIIQVVKFDQHQQGLHKRTRSEFPDPPAHVPAEGGNPPEIPSEPNRTEPNVTQPNLTQVPTAAQTPPLSFTGQGKDPDKKPASPWKRACAIAHSVMDEDPNTPANWSPEVKERLQLQHIDPRQRSPRGGQLFDDAVTYVTAVRRHRSARAS